MTEWVTGPRHPLERTVRKALDTAATAACPVYLAAWGDEFVKIGYSSNVRQRMKAIQSTCPVPVRLLGWLSGGQTVETRLHHRFAASRHVGEWFHFTDEIRAFVDNECFHGPAPIVKHLSYRYNLMDYETVEQLVKRLDVESRPNRADILAIAESAPVSGDAK